MYSLVDRDADRVRERGRDLRRLQLRDREATARTHAHVVATRHAAHNGEQLLRRAGERRTRLLHAALVAALLARGLVEPRAHAQVPVLVEVLVGNLVVMANHL